MPAIKSMNRVGNVLNNGKAVTAERVSKQIYIPELKEAEIIVTLVGDTPLLVNNKYNVAADIAEQYDDRGTTKKPKKPKDSYDQQYVKAFYVMPSSKLQPPNPKASYGIPASGIGKCIRAAIRLTGINDNTAVGLINKSFRVIADEGEGGLCRISFKKLVRDIRPVNIGSGTKTVPQMRHRPMFLGWSVDVRIIYNPITLSPEMLVNLCKFAGQYIGLHELRAQKGQGECGGFLVEAGRKRK